MQLGIYIYTSSPDNEFILYSLQRNARYREDHMDKEGSLALGTCTGNERSDRAHISGQQGNCKMYENDIKDYMLIKYIVNEEYLNIPQYM